MILLFYLLLFYEIYKFLTSNAYSNIYKGYLFVLQMLTSIVNSFVGTFTTLMTPPPVARSSM